MRFFRDLLLAALLVLGVLAGVELAFALAGVKYQGSFFVHEPERGYSYRPNAQGWAVDEGENYLRINSDGMPDRQRQIARANGEIRIAVIGASEVAAEQVPRELTFEDVMQRQLASALKRPASSIEVLNFGVAGYNLQQVYLTLHDHVWKYRPDIIVFGTTAMALIRSSPKLAPDAVPGTPFFDCQHIPEGDVSFAPASASLRGRLADLTNRSRILPMLNEAQQNGFKLLAKYRGMLARRKTEIAANAPLPTTDSVYNPDDPIYAQSWEIEDCIMRAMKRDADRHQAEFFLVVFDRSKAVDPVAANRARYAQKVGVPALFLTDERMAEQATRDGIATVLLGPSLLAYAEQHQAVLHGFFNTSYNMGHWNAVGNEAAGELISRALLDRSKLLREAQRSFSAERARAGVN